MYMRLMNFHTLTTHICKNACICARGVIQWLYRCYTTLLCDQDDINDLGAHRCQVTYTHTHTHTHIHIHTHIYTHTHTHTHIHTHTHTLVRRLPIHNTHARTHTCTNTNAHIHTHTYTHTYRHSHTHLHTNKHTRMYISDFLDL